MRTTPAVLMVALAFTAFPVAAAPETITGTVSLSPELKGKVLQTDAVYILARATQGARIPIAVFRKQVKDLPLEFVLDDSMSMQPQVKISSFDHVVIAARISKSGGAVTRPGDYEGVSAPVKPGTKGLNIVIDTQILSSSNRAQSI